jgi:hypothetical protein
MPATSKNQRIAMAIAEHEPAKLNPRNRGLLGMSRPQLHEFAATPRKGLPKLAKKKTTIGEMMAPQKKRPQPADDEEN